MIQMPQGFKVVSTESVDSRIVLTKTEMLQVKDGAMPQIYFAICKDDSNIYIYDKGNDIDEETGKFRLYAAGGDVEADVISSNQIKSLFIEEGETE